MGKLKILLREDFKYVVELPCPHNGEEIRTWCNRNKIPFVYYSAGPSWRATMAYSMTEESHAVWFKLRWG
jgi:hypothetical protein